MGVSLRFRATLATFTLWTLSFFLGTFLHKNAHWAETLKFPYPLPSRAIFSVMWIASHTLLASSVLALLPRIHSAKHKIKALTLLLLLFASVLLWLPLTVVMKSVLFAWLWILAIDILSAITLIYVVRTSIMAGILLTPHTLWCVLSTMFAHTIFSIN